MYQNYPLALSYKASFIVSYMFAIMKWVKPHSMCVLEVWLINTENLAVSTQGDPSFIHISLKSTLIISCFE